MPVPKIRHHFRFSTVDFASPDTEAAAVTREAKIARFDRDWVRFFLNATCLQRPVAGPKRDAWEFDFEVGGGSDEVYRVSVTLV